jgi:subtilisin family serine protease
LKTVVKILITTLPLLFLGCVEEVEDLVDEGTNSSYNFGTEESNISDTTGSETADETENSEEIVETPTASEESSETGETESSEEITETPSASEEDTTDPFGDLISEIFGAIMEELEAGDTTVAVEDSETSYDAVEEAIPVDSLDQEKSVYFGVPDDPIYNYQWHLIRLEVEDIWNNYRGDGIKIGIIDSGVQYNHPDLYDNIDFDNSFRYSDSTNNPSPDSDQLENDPYNSAGHGTACAGIIGAIGWNGEGVIGVAPMADLVGFNAFSTLSDADFEDALGNLNVQISSNSWGSGDSRVLYNDPSSLRGIERGIENGRDGKGILYIFASGNEGNNANHSTLHGSRYVFNIGAVTVDGDVQQYSNFGDNLLLVAYGGDGITGVNRGIFTTDLTGWEYGFDRSDDFTRVLRRYNGDYTGKMNGTSSAVPVVSGSTALILEANPNLTYRDVKYILSKTALQYNLYEDSYKWEKNSAGIWFSPYYGFGIINLPSAIEMAEDFVSLSDQVLASGGNSPYKDISDFETVVEEVEISENFSIEHVEVVVDITHPSISDLKVTITSPSGTESTLMYGDQNLTGVFSNWSLNSLRFLDENSSGVWTFKVEDVATGDEGVLKSWKLNIWGH